MIGWYISWQKILQLLPTLGNKTKQCAVWNSTNLDVNSSITAGTRAVSLFMSRLSTIETQLRRNKLSTHMTWQATALTSCTVFPWWFHKPDTFITVNICSTILNRKSKHNKTGNVSSSAEYTLSICILCSFVLICIIDLQVH